MKQRSSQAVSTPWQTGLPPRPGIYIIFDGIWQRRVRYDPGYRYNNEPCDWRSLRGYPAVWPAPLKWRKDDPLWSK